MKTPNLTKLAEILLALTWAEMNEIATSNLFGSSYSGAKPEKLIEWATEQLKMNVAPNITQQTPLTIPLALEFDEDPL